LLVATPVRARFDMVETIMMYGLSVITTPVKEAAMEKTGIVKRDIVNSRVPRAVPWWWWYYVHYL
jgi:hypothetical protein